MTFGSLFSGIGGIDLGLERAGMQCRWQVENHPYAAKVLEKHWPNVKRFDDVQTVEIFDEEGWRLVNRAEPIDVLAGGFPCQDISLASSTGVGIIGERSGLWKEFARIIAEVRPTFVLAENVPALRNRGLAMVLQDLWALGYDAEWHCIPASAFGAHHERDRIWIVAYPSGMFREAIIWGKPDGVVQGVSDFGWTWTNAYSDGLGCDGRAGELREAGRNESQNSDSAANADADGEPLVRAAIARGERHAWTAEPRVVRMVHGIPHRVDRLGRLGNAVVPQVVEWIGRRIIEAQRGRSRRIA